MTLLQLDLWVFLWQLPEQQQFQRSRRFLHRLGRSLGGDPTLYHQVVTVLQGSSAPTPEDMDKVKKVLIHYQHGDWLLLIRCSHQMTGVSPGYSWTGSGENCPVKEGVGFLFSSFRSRLSSNTTQPCRRNFGRIFSRPW